MMTAKICGSALLVLAAAIIAGYRVYQLRRRIASCRAMLALIRRIKSRIESSSEPLNRILSQQGDELLRPFAATAERYGLSEALTRHADGLCLCAEEIALLSECFEGMGQGFAESEAEHCSVYAQELSELCTRISGETPKKIKLTLTLAAFFALMAILLFI